MSSKSNTVELTVERVGARGDGIAEHAGKPVYLPFTAPGDHDFTYEQFDYDQAIRRLGSNSSEDQPPILGSER